jgi:hypothetical protein
MTRMGSKYKCSIANFPLDTHEECNTYSRQETSSDQFNEIKPSASIGLSFIKL